MNSPVTGLTRKGNKMQVTAGAHDLLADHVVSALPARTLGDILVDPSVGGLAKGLKSIKAVDVAVVNFGYTSRVLPLSGFGFLIPTSENSPALGVIFDSEVFQDQKWALLQYFFLAWLALPSQLLLFPCFSLSRSETRLTVMLGGHLFRERLGDPDTVSQKVILEKALAVVNGSLGITQTPESTSVAIHRGCIPQYTVGHRATLLSVREALLRGHLRGGLSVTGASYLGVSVNDCVYRARELAFRLTDDQRQDQATTGLEALV